MRATCAVAILALVGPAGCDEDHHAALEVLVEDTTGAALSGAVVTSEPASKQVTADSTGRALLPGLQPGTYLVSASLDGYLSATVQATAPAGTSSITMRLVSTGSLVAWYPFDGSSVDVAGGHDATEVSATPCPDRFGRDGLAYAFDGWRDIILLPALLTEATTQLTAAAWIRGEFVGNPVLPIVSVQNFTGFELGLAGGVYYWFAGPTCGVLGSSDEVVTSGEWQHVAVTRDGAMIRIYKQGMSTGGTVWDRAAAAGPWPTDAIGGTTGVCAGGRCFFSGAIEDVQVFTRALAAEEIAALAQR